MMRMKPRALMTVAILMATTAGLSAQSIPLKIASPSPTPGALEASRTVAGRVARLDTNAGTFTIKPNGSKKLILLKAGGDIDVRQLRRGERVEVTYSDGTATKVRATRSGP